MLRSPRAFLPLAAVAVLTLAACPGSEPSAVDNTAQVEHLEMVSGDLQSAPAGTEVHDPLLVRVTNGNGAPVKLAHVAFVVTAGTGSMRLDTIISDDEGLAGNRFTVGPGVASDTQRVEARVTRPGRSTLVVTFRETLQP